MKRLVMFFVVALVLGAASTCLAVMDGQGDYQRDDLGSYYAITGGKFINDQTVNGQLDSGGALAFIVDDPVWHDWGYTFTIDEWEKVESFEETAGLALTMKYEDDPVFDNFDNEDGDYYECPDGQESWETPGLYVHYSMSNNFDWISAGYFILSEETTIDEIKGYFDEYNGFDADNPQIHYRMNIWSNLDVAGDGYTEKRPAVESMTGDVFSSDSVAGTFDWGDTEIDRVFGDDSGNLHDDILYLTYTLDVPLVLQAGEYWFSHDAVIPEPGAVALLAFGLVVIAFRRRRG